MIEAVPERIDLKRALFAELDVVTPGHAILASNTSALSITEIGQVTIRPDKVVGLHFFYPASVARVVGGRATLRARIWNGELNGRITAHTPNGSRSV